jgi:hypothetical protein
MHNGRPELPALPVPEIVRLGACELRIHQLAGCVVVRPAGEIDLSNTDALRGHLSSLVERGHVADVLPIAARASIWQVRTELP